MPLVEFLPSGKKIQVDDTVTLAEAARRAGVVVELPCGGKGTCGRCLVTIVSGNVVRYTPPPDGSLPEEALACKTAVGSADCVIEVAEHDLACEDRSGDVAGAPFPVDGPLVAQSRIQVPAPRPDDGLSDLDRTNREIFRHFNIDEVRWGLSALRILPDSLRADAGDIVLSSCIQNDVLHVTGAGAWKNRARALGAAVDLGTTTVAVRIVDLSAGTVLAEMTGYNDQVHRGEDVISRINYAGTGERLAELKVRALSTMNRLIAETAERCGIPRDDIQCAVISGNTVMTHLALGITPEYLRLEPYTPAVLAVPEMRAADIGLDISPSGVVLMSPSDIGGAHLRHGE
ncbi:MAG TPA: 2Fe-2S iron-sulfur cluster-binding protein, partial [Spirochaetota bacterium]|nr:2Fe-2S iron-sulfur cluster-binding protein [Spirochaetota bacterium]